MIKAFIFDLSGVCFSNEEPIFLEIFIKRHNLNKEKFEKKYIELIIKSENGEITGEQAWNTLLKEFNIKEDLNKILDEMFSLKHIYTDMMNLIKKLRKKYKATYFTNYCKTYWDEVSKKYPLTPYFNFGLVCYKIKARKPAKKGFEYLIKKLKVKPEEIIYTDDSEKNLVNAKELGINVIHFKNKEQFIREIRKFGIKI